MKGSVNKNGFTLIELIAVIVVLSVLTVIIVPLAMNQLTSSKSKLYLRQVDLIENAAKTWGDDNGSKLPGSSEEFVYLSINELNEAGLIDRNKVRDPRNGSKMDGCVVISYDELYHQNSYQYRDTSCSELNPGGIPTIIVEGGTPQGVEVNTTYVLPKVESKNDNGDPLEVEGPIIRDKNNKVVQKVATGTIRDRYTLTYRSLDEASKKETEKLVSVKIIDTIAPVIEVNGKKASHTITHELGETFVIPTPTVTDNSKLTCSNNSTSKCTYSVSGNVNPKVLGTYNITYTATDDGEDLAGQHKNTTVYILTVKVVDTKAPVIKEIRPNTVKWTNQDVTLTIIPEDNDTNLSYSFDDGKTWQNSASKVYSSNQSVTARIKDSSGNISGSKTYRITNIDKLAPSCVAAINYNGRGLTVASGGQEAGWVNKNQVAVTASNPIRVTATCSDTGGSECKVASTSQDVTGNYNGKKTFTMYDNAGNSTVCSSSTIKVDQTAPSCSSAGGSSTWTNQNKTITGTCSDTGGSNCQGNVSKPFTSNVNGSYSPGTVYDKAGNGTSCAAQQVRIDKTPPTCSASVNYNGRSLTQASGKVESGWVNASQASVTESNPIIATATCGDNGGSACATPTQTFKITSTSYRGSPSFTVRDNAGNSGTCSTSTEIKVDQIAPYTPFAYSFTDDAGNSLTNMNGIKFYGYNPPILTEATWGGLNYSIEIDRSTPQCAGNYYSSIRFYDDRGGSGRFDEFRFVSEVRWNVDTSNCSNVRRGDQIPNWTDIAYENTSTFAGSAGTKSCGGRSVYIGESNGKTYYRSRDRAGNTSNQLMVNVTWCK